MRQLPRLFSVFVLALLALIEAHADCVSPTAKPGAIQVIQTNKFAYCDGTNWRDMGFEVQASPDVCTQRGRIEYRDLKLQACDGTGWQLLPSIAVQPILDGGPCSQNGQLYFGNGILGGCQNGRYILLKRLGTMTTLQANYIGGTTTASVDTKVYVKMWGAGGGGGSGALYYPSTQFAGGQGGGGAFLFVEVPLLAGQSLSMRTGGGGSGGQLFAATTILGLQTSSRVGSGGGGAGQTRVSVSGTSTLLAMAGGGGGGGGADPNRAGASGGAGGITSGQNGDSAFSNPPGQRYDYGEGGTQTRGGAGGDNINGGPGNGYSLTPSTVTGGYGGDATSANATQANGGNNGGGIGGSIYTAGYASGGGGGAGFYAGGGGGGAGGSGTIYYGGGGGGGGSSFVCATCRLFYSGSGSYRTPGGVSDAYQVMNPGTYGQGGQNGLGSNAGSNGQDGILIFAMDESLLTTP